MDGDLHYIHYLDRSNPLFQFRLMMILSCSCWGTSIKPLLFPPLPAKYNAMFRIIKIPRGLIIRSAGGSRLPYASFGTLSKPINPHFCFCHILILLDGFCLSFLGSVARPSIGSVWVPASGFKIMWSCYRIEWK